MDRGAAFWRCLALMCQYSFQLMSRLSLLLRETPACLMGKVGQLESMVKVLQEDLKKVSHLSTRMRHVDSRCDESEVRLNGTQCEASPTYL